MKKSSNNFFSISSQFFFQSIMSRQIGSLHRSNFHPANLQNSIPISPLFAFLPPDSPHMNRSSGIESDANSDITVFHTISQFENSDLETPDEFVD